MQRRTLLGHRSLHLLPQRKRRNLVKQEIFTAGGLHVLPLYPLMRGRVRVWRQRFAPMGQTAGNGDVVAEEPQLRVLR